MSDSGTNPAANDFEDFARRIGAFGGKAHAELRQAIAYLNDQVVPQVRQHSSTALRRAGEQLSRFADQLEQRHKER